MALYKVLWRELNTVFFLSDEITGPKVDTAARPLILATESSIYPGLSKNSTDILGFWRSSYGSDLLTAWRTVRLAAYLKQLRDFVGGRDTLAMIVYSLGHSQNDAHNRLLAGDFGLEVEAMLELVKSARKWWPTADELCAMWERMSPTLQVLNYNSIVTAIQDGNISTNPRLSEHLEQTAMLLRSAAEQREYEDRFVKTVRLSPEVSLKQLMYDLGVLNLVYAVGVGDVHDPEFFDLEDLDRQIMSFLIGSERVAEQIALYTSGSGTTFRPAVIFPSGVMLMMAVRWVRETERFQILIRPADAGEEDDSRDVWMPIIDIRTKVGENCGLNGLLPAGQLAPYLTNP